MAFNKTCEGQQMAVLIDKMGGRDGQVTGRSPFMQSVYLKEIIPSLGRWSRSLSKRLDKIHFGSNR